MSTKIRHLAVPLVLTASLVAVPVTAEARSCDRSDCLRPASSGSVGAWAEPQPALGGETLAAYVADHVAGVLGVVGV
jgi:hypothetical protein